MRVLLRIALLLSLLWSSWLWILNLIFALETVGGFGLVGLHESELPYLARVDQSTVTTLVLVLVLLGVARGILLLDRSRRRGEDPRRLWRQHFPFSAGFRALLVQLGLVGTIFAFIVAFGDLAQAEVADRAALEPSILIKPLGTALWSTLAGIVAAFLVVPPIERLFERLLGVDAKAKASPEAAVIALNYSLGSLEAQAKSSAASLELLAQQVAKLSTGLEPLVREVVECLAGTRQLILETSEELRLQREETARLVTALDRHATALEALARSQADLHVLASGISAFGRGVALAVGQEEFAS